jgi:hypothetical protein
MALPQNLLNKLSRCLEDEEVDVYTLTLYGLNSKDMEYFDEEDRRRIKAIFNVLMEDTRRHMDLLKLIVEVGGPS